MKLIFWIAALVLLSCFLAGSCSARVLHQTTGFTPRTFSEAVVAADGPPDSTASPITEPAATSNTGTGPIVYSTVPTMDTSAVPAPSADAAGNASEPAAGFPFGLGLRDRLAASMPAVDPSAAENTTEVAAAPQFGFGLRDRLAAAAMPAAVGDAAAVAGAVPAATAEANNMFGQGLMNWGLRNRLADSLQLPAISAMQGEDNNTVVVEVPATGDVEEAVRQAVAEQTGETVGTVETVTEEKESKDTEDKEDDKAEDNKPAETEVKAEKPASLIDFPLLAVLPDAAKKAKADLEAKVSEASDVLEKFKSGELQVELPSKEAVKSTVRSTVKKAAEDPIGLVTEKIDPEIMVALEKSIEQSQKMADALIAVREAQKEAEAAKPKSEDDITFAAWAKEWIDKYNTVLKYVNVDPVEIKVEEDDDNNNDDNNTFIIKRPARSPRPGGPTRPGRSPRPGGSSRPGGSPRPGRTPRSGMSARPGSSPRPGKFPRPDRTPKP